jgi:hypothetical protein
MSDTDPEYLSPSEIKAAMKQMLAWIEPVRQQIYEGRKLTGHMDNPPRWQLHLSRLRELESLLRRRRVEDWPEIKDLEITFRLDHGADMAASRAEVSERMVRFMDDISQRTEDRKFTMKPEARDSLEEMLGPYQDKIREQMLSELPIAVRLQLEENKLRLRERGTLDEGDSSGAKA